MKRPEILISFVAFLLVFFFTDRSWLTAVGVGFVLGMTYNVLDECNERIPIDKLIILFAAIQWIFGPFLAYSGFNDHYKYHMYVEESTYMRLAVPGVLFFWFGLMLFRLRDDRSYFQSTFDSIQRTPPLYAYYLIFFGISASFLSSFVPVSLRFVFFLLAQIQYVGLVYLLLSQSKRKALVISLSLGSILVGSIKAAMFHDLILWVILLGLYLLYYFKFSIQKKISFFLIGVSALFVIQVVKSDYRQKLWIGELSGQEVHYFALLVQNQLTGDNLFSKSNIEGLVIRINQGWIVSRIMEQVPDLIPFANGETVSTAFKASLLPRFLVPDKKFAGGKENYTRFTQYSLEGTSMGISLLGEGYVNFGIQGAWAFLFAIGAFYALIFRRLLRFSVKYPGLLLWLPLIFLQVLKAETELVVVLNYLVKALVLVGLVHYFFKRFLRWEI